MRIFEWFKKEPEGKRPLRDKTGRPYYLNKLPFHRRHPTAFVLCGVFFSFGTLYSAPLYRLFFTTEADIKDQNDWWHHEKQRGYRDKDMWKQKIEIAGPEASLVKVFHAKPDVAKLREKARMDLAAEHDASSKQ